MKHILILFLSLSLGLSACAAQPETNPEELARLNATETAVPASPTPLPTDTPAPTHTPLPTGTPAPTSTNTPVPTPDYTATLAAKATGEAGEVIEQIAPILEEYHLSAGQGSLGWVQEKPVIITVNQYGESKSVPLDPRSTFSDFALYVEATWESQSGLAGCGIVFHAEEDPEGEQYRFETLRFKGVPVWMVSFWRDGKPQPGGMPESKLNKAINQKQGGTNRYMLVLEEGLLTLYANGTELGQVEITERTGGLIHFLAFQESMKTTCTFENAWIWSLK